MRGAYSLLFLAEGALVAARAPHGIRPLVLGRIKRARAGAYAHGFAAGTCAFDLIGAEFVREVEPGEMIVADARGLRTLSTGEARRHFCVFEQVYFARPDSIVFDQSVHNIRVQFGAALAKEKPVEADWVIPVPDSGVSPAIGYAHASGIPFERCYIRNHYVGRTFIEPEKAGRAEGVRFKLNIVKDVVRASDSWWWTIPSYGGPPPSPGSGPFERRVPRRSTCGSVLRLAGTPAIIESTSPTPGN